MMRPIRLIRQILSSPDTMTVYYRLEVFRSWSRSKNQRSTRGTHEDPQYFAPEWIHYYIRTMSKTLNILPKKKKVEVSCFEKEIQGFYSIVWLVTSALIQKRHLSTSYAEILSTLLDVPLLGILFRVITTLCPLRWPGHVGEKDSLNLDGSPDRPNEVQYAMISCERGNSV